MAYVEDVFETARRGLADPAARRQSLRHCKESLSVAERNAAPDVILAKNARKLVAVSDGGNDRQAGT